mmetsp:Transcript_10907/g.33435  ORF Transcript_10907/g.33435 Transcript_10907/m.33435 type:complete len:943 (-) Transcript_10907:105-2933(-)
MPTDESGVSAEELAALSQLTGHIISLTEVEAPSLAKACTLRLECCKLVFLLERFLLQGFRNRALFFLSPTSLWEYFREVVGCVPKGAQPQVCSLLKVARSFSSDGAARARAFLLLCLDSGLLAEYLSALVFSRHLTAENYTPNAFIRDRENFEILRATLSTLAPITRGLLIREAAVVDCLLSGELPASSAEFLSSVCPLPLGVVSTSPSSPSGVRSASTSVSLEPPSSLGSSSSLVTSSSSLASQWRATATAISASAASTVAHGGSATLHGHDQSSLDHAGTSPSHSARQQAPQRKRGIHLTQTAHSVDVLVSSPPSQVHTTDRSSALTSPSAVRNSRSAESLLIPGDVVAAQRMHRSPAHSTRWEEESFAEEDDQVPYLKLLRVWKLLEPQPKDLLHRSRRLVKEGPVRVQRYQLAESKPQPLRDHYLFLLNDQLLITTKEKRGLFSLTRNDSEPFHYRLEVMISLNSGLRVHDYIDDEVAIDIQTPSKKNFFLFFEDGLTRDQWLGELRAAIEETRYRADFAAISPHPAHHHSHSHTTLPSVFDSRAAPSLVVDQRSTSSGQPESVRRTRAHTASSALQPRLQPTLTNSVHSSSASCAFAPVSVSVAVSESESESESASASASLSAGQVLITAEVGVLCENPYPEPKTRTPSPSPSASAPRSRSHSPTTTAVSSPPEPDAAETAVHESTDPSSTQPLSLLRRNQALTRIQRQKSDWWQSLVVSNPGKAESMIRDGMLEPAHRPAVWTAFAGVCARQRGREDRLYERLVTQIAQDTTLVSDYNTIQLDVKRVRLLGADPALKAALSRLLSAYQLFDGERMGYFQGQAFIASTLLAQLGDEVESFWVFVHLMEVFFLGAADCADNPATPVDQLLQSDFVLLDGLVTQLLPDLATHLAHVRASVGLFARPWFSALYCQTFPPRRLPAFFDRLLGFGSLLARLF